MIVLFLSEGKALRGRKESPRGIMILPRFIPCPATLKSDSAIVASDGSVRLEAPVDFSPPAPRGLRPDRATCIGACCVSVSLLLNHPLARHACPLPSLFRNSFWPVL